MYKNKSFLAIIPAREGSKRLPNKNKLKLNGKPLIAWSIDSALKSEYLDKVLVSSDDKEILDIASKCKADIIERPKKFASDSASIFDVLKHSISIFDNFEYIVLLQPTSPLRNENHIDEAINLLDTKKADAIISVCEMDHSPLWSNTLDSNLSMKKFFKKKIINKRSQDLPLYYRINGAIYICKVDKLLNEKSFFLKENVYAYKMDRESSIDIDENIDFKLATLIINSENSNNTSITI